MNEFEELVRNSGVESASIWLSQQVMKKINSYEVALQFVLEEIEAASDGNDAAVRFVENSGFNPSEYKEAMSNSFDEVDGENGPQQFLLSAVLMIQDVDLMVSLRITTVDKIMQHWNLGKYK